MFQGRHIIAICGPGGAGKDAAANIIADITGMRYKFSTSFGAADSFWHGVRNGLQVHRGMRPDEYNSFEDFYKDRVNRREAWADYIDELNRDDPAGLYRYCLEKGNDFLTGIRKRHEWIAVEKEGWVDLRIWIDGPVPPDPTLEYDSVFCDMTIVNPKVSLSDLRRKLLNIFVRIPYYFFPIDRARLHECNHLGGRYIEQLTKQDSADSGRPAQRNVSHSSD